MCAVAKFDPMWRHRFAFFLLFWGFGCAGELEPTPEDGEGTGKTAVKGGGSTSSPADTEAAADKKRLGNCTPGIKRSETPDCRWIADETCYPTWDAACNCICPTNVGEVYCLSDFPEDGIPTRVTCN